MAAGARVSVVVGVDGSGRTYRLGQLAREHPDARLVTAPLAQLDQVPAGLLLVDDAHRLTAAQLVELAQAARQGAAMAIARRPSITSPELAGLDEALSRQGTVEQLAPLTPAEVAALASRVTGTAVSPQVAAQLHAATAGLPALVALAAPAAAGPGSPAWSTPALVARVQRRLAQMPPPVAALARLLALRLELTDPVLAAAAGLDEGGLAAAMRTLRDEGFLEPGAEVMLMAVAAATLADLPAAQRRRVHDELARALVSGGGDAQVTAAQLRAARVYTPVAGEIYLAVAERLRFSDPAAAAGWYDDAADAGADPPRVVAGRAETAAQLGRPLDVGDGGEAVPGGQRDEVRARIALAEGAVLAHEGRAERAGQALLEAPPPGPSLAVPALVSAGRLAQAQEAAGGTGPAAVRVLAQAALVAARDPVSAVPLLIEAAELAERSVPPVVLPDTPHAIGAVAATAAGDVATAEHLLERALTAGTGGPGATARHRLLLAFVRMRAGRYDTAVTELARRSDAPLRGRERLLHAALQAGIARRGGDVAKLRDAWSSIEPALARRTVDLFAAEAVEELAVAAIRLRRQARVEPVLDTLDAIVHELGRPAPWALTVAWVRLQAAVADEGGDHDAVARAAAAMPASTPASGLSPRHQAQLAAAQRWAEVIAGQVDAELVLAAGERLAEAQLPWEGSRLVGQAAIRTSDAGAARRLLERARELSAAEVLPAQRGQEGPAGLSEREVEVARMVLGGSTYREIGARLFISPKTVEHHVARIRTKLGANTRAEFVAALRDVLDPA